MSQVAIVGLPDPIELGFPEKFQGWREDQLRGIDQVLASTKRVIALTMPTGSGKSLTYIAAALLDKGVKRACILTATKGLQDQLVTDFSTIGLCDIRGQRNYPCRAVERGGVLDRFRRGRYHGCDDGPCHAGVRCSMGVDRFAPETRPDCEYFGAVHDARRSSLVVTNYAYWLSSGAYSQGLGAFELLILDEAHQATDELDSFLTFKITPEDASRISSKMLDSQEVRDWQTWARAHVGPLKASLEIRKSLPPNDSEGVTDLRKMEGILGKLDRLATLQDDEWVLDLDGSAEFAPLRSGQYVEQYLFQRVPKIVLTSATLTKKTISLLGVKDVDVHHWECPSRFDVARRPVIHVSPMPEVRVTHAMPDVHRLLWRRRIDRFIAPRIDRKGIIHTVSYARMRELLAESDHRGCFVVHGSGDTLSAVAEFKRRPAPCILVSPSIMTGFDFPHDECRWQVIGKVPLLDTRSALLTARKEQDPDYQYYIAMQKLVQAVGRGMRASDDWCETAIVDDVFGWFFRKYKKHAPKWFVESVYVIDHNPDVLDPDSFSEL